VNTSNQIRRRIVTLVSVLALAAGVGLTGSRDRVNEICLIAGDISYCAPDGR
jgi:hypothetical protein